ncbi:MAG: hypothetical protein HYU24_12970 [Candidatus Rokubacteria bacterium]|nr:hypothetical protein [Candidatus Rokubacteria bacterium]
MYRIGYLGTVPPLSYMWDALLEGLRERGWVEGKNIVFERRLLGTLSLWAALARFGRATS